MNIFILDTNPIIAAQMQMNKHVVKMCVETAQLLSTQVNGPYKPTHIHHPCTKWTGQSSENFQWLVEHGLALCDEYTYRYDKIHKCKSVIEQCAKLIDKIPKGCLTPFAQAMPDEFKNNDPVIAYRNYYKSKKNFAKWTKREIPYWW